MRDLSDGLKDRLKDRVTVVSTEQDFGPNGIGGAWCADPDMFAISGGAELSSADVANDVAVRSRGRTPRTPQTRLTVTGGRCS